MKRILQGTLWLQIIFVLGIWFQNWFPHSGISTARHGSQEILEGQQCFCRHCKFLNILEKSFASYHMFVSYLISTTYMDTRVHSKQERLIGKILNLGLQDDRMKMLLNESKTDFSIGA